MQAWIFYCRAGFEKDLAAECSEWFAHWGWHGYARATDGAGMVEFVAQNDEGQEPRLRHLVFARQMLRVIDRLEGLNVRDRIAPMLARLKQQPQMYTDVFVETLDNEASQPFVPLAKKITVPLRKALESADLLDANQTSLPRLHVLFTETDAVILATSQPRNRVEWPMGIPRLKANKTAPSRSHLKLEEAWYALLSERERETLLKPGMTAVDLGAAPGGWTWQLVKRHIRVTAVDNGPMQEQLLESGIVKHVQQDAFKYQPKEPVDWLVCDVVEQPQRITQLVSHWIGNRWCKYAVVNLKLPMKQRWKMVQDCIHQIDTVANADGRYEWRARHLYHDRDEITLVLLPS